MRCLLDTSVLLALSRDETARLAPRLRNAVLSRPEESYASVVSLWEIAIKTRLGKLDPMITPSDLPAYYRTIGLALLTINEHHVLAEVVPAPATRDPFDRLLLAQCQVEGLRLITADRALAGHPLAWA